MITIHLIRKPVPRTVAENVLKHGTGGLNIDACRQHAGADYYNKTPSPGRTESAMAYFGSIQTRPWVQRKLAAGIPIKEDKPPNEIGRYPNNMVFEHLPGCRKAGTKKVHVGNGGAEGTGLGHGNTKGYGIYNGVGGVVCSTYADGAGEEIIDDWRCAPGCPVDKLGQQSGVSMSAGGWTTGVGSDDGRVYGFDDNRYGANAGGLGDRGTAARYFKQIGGTVEKKPWNNK